MSEWITSKVLALLATNLIVRSLVSAFWQRIQIQEKKNYTRYIVTTYSTEPYGLMNIFLMVFK